MSVNSISEVKQLIPDSVGLSNINEESKAPGISFGEYLNSALMKVTDLENNSDQLKEDFALGKTDNIPEVLLAGEKASVALQFTMQIRNKILDAYSEIMRMQI
ncbi:flagellar hook-basal body complex protein FliE [Ruminiclostridium cellobioparum]|jgi:flagellar hook-basal body complex protein FliE|uniref:Flagellar hook-basal body complex protein FliE n=1 Tax=Ruminiclostridium cellobioparum subsp. termitidis CT1112 TaxID=1195236 RepID=S0FHE3_RUMCE|nr:flagellar hook-basal body complex protein FliE [Ruminiclostridium cellobioparum]EMS71150.1 flagellar hook-basal body complex protein FliE [Ruminiclostridium cellobioparum subsp. termitidis CT1112]